MNHLSAHLILARRCELPSRGDMYWMVISSPARIAVCAVSCRLRSRATLNLALQTQLCERKEKVG